jgi:polyketide cyclase/dehydrase/lipid transport protein
MAEVAMFRVLVLLPLLVGPAGYKHVGGRHGVEVFRRMSSPAIELYAEGDIEAPPAVVRDVLLDYDHASKVTDNVAESHILSKNDREIIVYQRLDLPVIADRDYTLRARWADRGETKLVSYSVENYRGPPPRDKVVRIPTLTGAWELDPLRGGAATHARFHVVIDLAGSVPKWMVSGGSAKNLPKVFEGLRRETAIRLPGYPVAGRGH